MRGLLLLASVLLSTSGCIGVSTDRPNVASSRPTTTTAPSPTASPAKDELIAILQRTHASPFRYAVQSNLPESSSVSATGAFDPAGKLFEATVTMTGGATAGTLRRIVVNTDSYLRQGDEKIWVHLDLTRVKKGSLVSFDMTDPIGLAKFTSTITSAQRTDARTFTGRFNPYASGPEFLPIGAPSLWTIGTGVAPFTITTDEQDRVTSIHIELSTPDKPKLVMTTTLSEHGKPLPTKAPPKASVREAADVYYN